MTKRQLIVAAFTAVCLLGQQTGDYITFGDERLKLGMPRNQVLARLVGSFDLSGKEGRTSPCESDCVIWEKGGPPSKWVGNIGFTGGRLDGASKSWGPDDQAQGVPTAQAFYGAMSELVKGGVEQCYVQVGERESPGADARSVNITCGDGHVVGINILRSDRYGDAVDVSERLIK